jgi:hypothetical protein
VIARDAADMHEAQMREESVPLKEIFMRMIRFQGIIQPVDQRRPRFGLQLAEHSPHTVLGLVHGEAESRGHVGDALASSQDFENSLLEVRQLWRAESHRLRSLIVDWRVA